MAGAARRRPANPARTGRAQLVEARVVFVEADAATPAIQKNHFANIEACASFFALGRAIAPPHVPSILDSALPGGLAFMLELHLERGSDEPTLGLYPELLRLVLLPYLGDEQPPASSPSLMQ